MNELTEKKKKRIAALLKERQVKMVCPMCGNNGFVMLDGYFNETIQGNLDGIVLGGPSVPSIGLACSRCGFISQHALGVLGLLKKEANAKDE